MIATRLDMGFLNELRAAVRSQLPEHLPAQRWFRAKARRIQTVELADCIALRLARGRALVTLVRAEYTEGSGETYVVPLLEGPRGEESGKAAIVRLRDPDTSTETVLTDALASQDFLSVLLQRIKEGTAQQGEQGSLLGSPTSVLGSLLPKGGEILSARVLKAEQSNTSIVYGDRLILKFYRRVEEGINPDLEIGRFLTEVAHFSRTPPLGGSLEYETRDGRNATLGILQGFVANKGDAWSHVLRLLKELTESVTALIEKDDAARAKIAEAREVRGLPQGIFKQISQQTKVLGLLGKRTAEMHLALASSASDPAFSPEPVTPAFRESLEGSLHDLAVRNFDLLRSKAEALPDEVRRAAEEVLKLEEDVLLTFHQTLENDVAATRTRIHGDYHLGQVLFADSDFIIIDFEGEPARPVSERRVKRSPLQDVAGMLRSFHYAERSALLEAETGMGTRNGREVGKILSLWRREVTREFLQEYDRAASGASFLPSNAAVREALLRLHVLEKAIYEMGYELNNRPTWLAIPLDGIKELVGRGA